MYRKLLYPLLGLAAGGMVYGCSAEDPAAPDLDAPLFGKTAGKVDLCHMTGTDDLVEVDMATGEMVGIFREDVPIGHVISVSRNAVGAHVRDHGDLWEYSEAVEPGICHEELPPRPSDGPTLVWIGSFGGL